MIRRASISLRLAAWFAAILFLGWMLFGVAMRMNLEHALTTARYQTLSRRAERLAELLNKLSGMPADIQERKFLDFAKATGDGLLEVRFLNGQRVFPSPSPDSEAFPWPSIVRGEQFSKVRYANQQYRVLERSVQVGDSTYYVLLAAPLAGNLALLDRFTLGLLLAVPVLLLASAVCGYFVCRKALAPVSRIIDAVRSISVWNLSERLQTPETQDELHRLAETCNEMLERLESAVTQINQFTSNASHELRTPLSVIRTTAEVALIHPETDPESRKAFEEIVRECAHSAQTLEDLLTLARADGEQAEKNFVLLDPLPLVHAIYHQARILADGKEQTILVRADTNAAQLIRSDQTLFERLFWILLDNAIKYTPNGGRIAVELSARGQHLLLAVEDNGIGIPEGEAARVIERFYRTDTARAVADGSGLGLAIANWIARLHHAELRICEHRAVGTRIEVLFPAVRPLWSDTQAENEASVLDSTC